MLQIEIPRIVSISQILQSATGDFRAMKMVMVVFVIIIIIIIIINIHHPFNNECKLAKSKRQSTD